MRPVCGKVLGDGIVHRQDREIAEKVAQPGERRLGIGGVEGAFVDLGDSDDADGQALVAEALERALRAWAADGGVNQLIGINEIPHGREIGRVPSSRPR